MITIGVDAHKDTHTMVALDATGRQLGTITVPARTHGHRTALAWADTVLVKAAEREPAGELPALVWGIEDCRHVTGLLERDLLAAGHRAVRVPTVMSTRYRKGSRTPGKSDAIDARAIARAAQSEDHLPQVMHNQDLDEITALREITRARDALVHDRTRQISRVIGDLHRLDPDAPTGDLTTHRHLEALRGWLRRHHPDRGDTRVLRGLLLADLTALLALNKRINALTLQLRHHPLVQHSPLRSIPGCGDVLTADLLSTIGDIGNYRSRDAFASAAGVAPIPLASGRSTSMRINTGGNRRLNRALHSIALYQAHHENTPGYAHYHAAIARGKTPRAALRILRCHLARYTWKTLKNTQPLT